MLCYSWFFFSLNVSQIKVIILLCYNFHYVSLYVSFWKKKIWVMLRICRRLCLNFGENKRGSTCPGRLNVVEKGPRGQSCCTCILYKHPESSINQAPHSGCLFFYFFLFFSFLWLKRKKIQNPPIANRHVSVEPANSWKSSPTSLLI